MKLFAEISKTEAQDDGTIKVWGYASSAAVDADGETITADAMKAALPDYMKFGAVREMHGKNAAGTAIEARVEDDGRTFFGAHIVDPVAVKKVQANVYKGFSIGGRVTARDDLNKSVIKGLNLVEISLVDRPANPEAVFTCYKADGVDPEAQSQDGEGPAQADEASEQPDAVEPVAKSLYSVARLATLTADVCEFANYAEFEDEYEGHHPELSGKVRDAAKVLASALQELAAAEASYIAGEEGEAEGEGEKEAAATADAAQQAEQAAEDLQKMADTSNELQKALDATKDALAKAEQARDEAVTKAEASAARIKELEKRAEPPKAFLKPAAITKAADTGAEPLTGFAGVANGDGSLNEAATLIKAAHAGILK